MEKIDIFSKTTVEREMVFSPHRGTLSNMLKQLATAAAMLKLNENVSFSFSPDEQGLILPS